MILDGSSDTDMITAFRTFSASLPPIYGAPGRQWNGRDLTPGEMRGAQEAAYRAFVRGEGFGSGAQAAHEYLSEVAW